MVPMKNCVSITEIRKVQRVDIDGTADTFVTLGIMGQIEEVITMLHNRIINYRARTVYPCADFGILFGPELIKINAQRRMPDG